MPANSSTTDPEALEPTSSSGNGRDADIEKTALLHRAGSKNLRTAVSQAPKEVMPQPRINRTGTHRSAGKHNFKQWLQPQVEALAVVLPKHQGRIFTATFLFLQAMHQIVHSWFSRKFATGW
jgi:hypothetical protein